MIEIEVGKLSASLSPRPDFERGSPGEKTRPAVYGIKVRKDQPLVLDFSTKPEVVFTNPPQEKTFKPGEQISFEALLTDPALGVMIRGLNDTSRKVREQKYRDEDGKERTYILYASLDPTVVITDASGKQLAEGKMPFG